MLSKLSPIVLIGCSDTKLKQRAEARHLYQGALFKRSAEFASTLGPSGAEWYVLSAKFGLLHPAASIDPYNFRMKDMRRQDRAEWGHRAVMELSRRHDPLSDHKVIILAGKDYYEWLLEPLSGLSVTVERPWAGLKGIGEQLRWLNGEIAAARR